MDMIAICAPGVSDTVTAHPLRHRDIRPDFASESAGIPQGQRDAIAEGIKQIVLTPALVADRAKALDLIKKMIGCPLLVRDQPIGLLRRV